MMGEWIGNTWRKLKNRFGGGGGEESRGHCNGVASSSSSNNNNGDLLPKLYSTFSTRFGKKRQADEQVPPLVELTDDEDENISSNDNSDWSYQHRSKKMRRGSPERRVVVPPRKGGGGGGSALKMTNTNSNSRSGPSSADDERVREVIRRRREEGYITRGSGIDPSIPGRPIQPWEFDFSFGGRSSRSASRESDVQIVKVKTATASSSLQKIAESESAKPKAPVRERIIPIQMASASSAYFPPSLYSPTSFAPSTSSGTTTGGIPDNNRTRESQRLGRNSGNFSGFTFSKPNPTKSHVDVITINDGSSEAKPLHFPAKTSQFRSSSQSLTENPVGRKISTDLVTSPPSKPINKTSKRPAAASFIKSAKALGRSIIDPIIQTCRLEERDRYKLLVQNTEFIPSTFRALNFSKVSPDEMNATFHHRRDFGSSPTVSFQRRSSLPRKYPTSISERVKNDLTLMPTPAASRSSGSSPFGPQSPLFIDLEADEKEKEKAVVLLRKSDGGGGIAQNSSPYADHFATSFADLDEALQAHERSQNLDETVTDFPAVKETEEDSRSSSDITILSETINSKWGEGKLNSLELENSQLPYVSKQWLNSGIATRKENQERRGKEIEEHLMTLDVLHKESTLERDLRDDIRRVINLTEIIVLEEQPPPLPEITSEMAQIINSAKRYGKEDEVLSKVHTIDFYRGDVKTLAPGKWLNDNVINCYLELVKNRSEADPSLPKVHYLSTFFYPKLLKEGYSNGLKRWTRKYDIFSADIVLFPIHLGLHWCMAAVHMKEKWIQYFDSLGGRNDRCLNALLSYLAAEMKERKGQVLDKTEWRLENVADVPQQENGSDCGVFTCKCGEYLSRNAKLDYKQINMDYYRDRMIYELISRELLFP